MTPRQTFSRSLLIFGLLGAGATVIRAQAGPEPTGGSLATLIAEVRQLRQAVEDSAKSQSQAQAIGVYLSAQQSRLVQITTRLDTLRAEINGAALQTQAVSRVLATAETAQSQPMSPEERAESSDMMRWFKEQVDQAKHREQQLRQREAELLQSYQVEENRWNDLIAQLDRLVRR